MGAPTAVAKKKALKPGPKPSPQGPRGSLIAIKCRDEWKAWVAELADSERTTPSQLIDVALKAYGEAKGFRAPPKR